MVRICIALGGNGHKPPGQKSPRGNSPPGKRPPGQKTPGEKVPSGDIFYCIGSRQLNHSSVLPVFGSLLSSVDVFRSHRRLLSWDLTPDCKFALLYCGVQPARYVLHTRSSAVGRKPRDAAYNLTMLFCIKSGKICLPVELRFISCFDIDLPWMTLNGHLKSRRLYVNFWYFIIFM